LGRPADPPSHRTVPCGCPPACVARIGQPSLDCWTLAQDARPAKFPDVRPPVATRHLARVERPDPFRPRQERLPRSFPTQPGGQPHGTFIPSSSDRRPHQGPSDKPGKRLASRRLRTAIHRTLRTGAWELLPHRRQFGSPWDFPKDGKRWFGSAMHLATASSRFFASRGLWPLSFWSLPSGSLASRARARSARPASLLIHHEFP